MPTFNKVMLIANLTRDPSHKMLPSQTILVEFGLAMNRKYRTAAGEDREEVCFVDCTAFGKIAEVIHQYCKKGDPIFVEGRLKWDSWEDKQGGSKRSKLTVIVEGFQFLPRAKGDRADDDSREPEHRPTPQNRLAPARGEYRPTGGGKPDRETAEAPFTGEHEFDEKDIPFVWSGRSSRAI